MLRQALGHRRQSLGTTKLGANDTNSVTAPGSVTGIPTYSLVTNTTAVRPTVSTFLTLSAGGDTKPAVSNLNPSRGQVVANATITDLGFGNKLNIYNYLGSTDVLVDVLGSMEYIPTTRPTAAAQPTRSLTTTKAEPAGSQMWSGSDVGSPIRRRVL